MMSRIGIFSLVILFTCCRGAEYDYLDGFGQYMSEVHRIDIHTDEKLFYVLPISDCNSCMSTTLNLETLFSLEQPNENLSIVLIGKTNRQDFQKKIERLSTSYNVLHDKNQLINSFRTGLDKPMLLHLEQGQLKYYLKIIDPKIEKAKGYLVSMS